MSMVPLDKITLDSRLQHRKCLDEDMIVDLKEAYRAGRQDIPPITLIFDGETHWLPDGHHRYFGRKAGGYKEIDANVYDGDFRAALLYSLGVNAIHGIRRTNMDLREIVRNALSDPEIASKRDADIAELLNCSVRSLLIYRKEMLEEQRPHPEVDMLPDQPEHKVQQPRVVNKDAIAERKIAALRRKVQRVYGQLANLVEEMGLWDVLATHVAAIKHHTGIV